jgi:hypothetical protein
MVFFNAMRDMLVQLCSEVGDYIRIGHRDIRRRNVKDHEVIVVREIHHHFGLGERTRRQEFANRAGGRLKNLVQLFPAVDLFDLGVAIEVEVDDEQLLSILNRLTD